MKPSQYIAQHLYEQKRKSNCSSCSSQTSYLSGSKIFIAHCIRSHYCTIVKNKTKKRTWKPAFLLYLFLWMSECMILRHQKARALSMQWLRASLNIFFFCVPSPTSQLLLFWCRTEQLEKATFFSSCCDQKNRFCFCVSPTELAWEQCGAGLPWWFEAQTKNDGKKEVASKNFARANAAGAWSTVVYDRLNWGYQKVGWFTGIDQKSILRTWSL